MKRLWTMTLRTVLIGFSFVVCTCSIQNSSYSSEVAPSGPKVTSMERSRSVPWTPSEFSGISPGKSSIRDVKKLLGEPVSQMPPEDKYYVSDPENELELYYRNVKGFPAVVFTIGERSALVKSISVDFPKPTPLDEIVKEFGSEFYPVSSLTEFCIDPKMKAGQMNDDLTFPYFLVYPNKGTIVFITYGNLSTYYSILYKCDIE